MIARSVLRIVARQSRAMYALPSSSVTSICAHAVDDVVIGEDVAAWIDDHAGAHAVHLARGFLSAPRDGRFGDGFLALDIHHRSAGALDGPHDGGHAAGRSFAFG